MKFRLVPFSLSVYALNVSKSSSATHRTRIGGQTAKKGAYANNSFAFCIFFMIGTLKGQRLSQPLQPIQSDADASSCP